MGTGYDISASASVASSAANTAGTRSSIGPVTFGGVNFSQPSKTNWTIIALIAAALLILAFRKTLFKR